MPSSRSAERNILLFSVIVALVFSVMGTTWGFITNSLVILFDGFYSLTSLILSLISLLASRYIDKPDNGAFHYGRARIEPLVIAFKGAMLLLLLSITFVSGIQSVLNGGNDLKALDVILFGIINVVGCFGSWWYIKQQARKTHSRLAHAEAAQWVMDTALSSGVLVGFLISMTLQFTPYAHLAHYADPVMAILVTFLFFKEPLAMLCEGIRELLMMAPDPELENEVIRRVHLSGEQPENIRIAKVGRELHLTMDYPVNDLRTGANFRSKLHDRFHDFELNLQLSINYLPRETRQ